jgi:hypothetical protein
MVALAIEYGAYLTALSWLAWFWLRRRGEDFFLVAIFWTVGILLVEIVGVSWATVLFASLFITLGTCYCCWPHKSANPTHSKSILEILVPSLLALVVLAQASSHQTIFWQAPQLSKLTALFAAHFLILLALTTSRSRSSLVLRAGAHSSHLLEGWGVHVGVTSVQLTCVFCAALCIMILPTVTIGVLSASMLRDLLFAALLARLVAGRSPVLLVSTSYMFGAARSTLAFALGNTAGIFMVDACILATLLIAAGEQFRRSSWQERDIS